MDAQKDPATKAKELEEANRLFESVWKRVMRGAQLCPIVLHEPEEGQTTEGGASGQKKVPLELPVTLCSAIVSAQEDGDEIDCEDDFPSRKAVPFLGSGSAPFEELLQECIWREMHCRLVYKTLGQRAGGAAAKHLSEMAAENLRAAKRLGAACFLITGAQPKPAPMPRLTISSYLHTLREHFIEEQQSSALYLAAAAESRDPWLIRLFSELAEEKLQHAQKIYLLVEMA